MVDKIENNIGAISQRSGTKAIREVFIRLFREKKLGAVGLIIVVVPLQKKILKLMVKMLSLQIIQQT